MSLILSGTDGLSDIDGSAATPAIRGTDANTGIFFGTDIIGFSEGGVEAARINADSQFVAAAGTAALPVITTTGDLNTGIFFPAADTIAFAEGGAEAMRIDSSGNVGIGTTSPSTYGQFAVYTAASNTEIAAVTDGANYATYRLQNSSRRYSMQIRTDQSNAWTLRDETAGANRLLVDTSGNLLVGTTSSFSGGNVLGVMAQASGLPPLGLNRTTSTGPIVRFYYASTEVGNISVTGSATAYNTSSDYRLKNTIAPMTGALAKVALLKPCTYKWNADGRDGQGFIAHELAGVVPDCVTGEKDATETYTDEDGNEATRPAYQGIDVSFLVATLTAAIQEQQALITDLTARITALETQSADNPVQGETP